MSSIHCFSSPLAAFYVRRDVAADMKLRSSLWNAYEAKIQSKAMSCGRNSIINALQVREGAITRTDDKEAARQGIRIRRYPPAPSPLPSGESFDPILQNESNIPQNILEEIIWNKTTEISQLKKTLPLSWLKESLVGAPPTRDFIRALETTCLRTGVPALIAEVKKASPSRGILREDFDPVQIARAYEEGGAACLSILTDEKYFQGCFENLEAIRKAGINCPLLCKEFIIDTWQLYYARLKGADAVLLVMAILHDDEIRSMIKICEELCLAALVEVHNEQEMDRVMRIEGIRIIGINNRNLETFEVDISNTQKLLEGKWWQSISERGILVVGESGIFTPDHIAYVQQAGVKAVLVGESIVKHADPREGITGLYGKSIAV